MDPITTGVVGTLCVFFLLFIGMPIAFALMLVGLLAHRLSFRYGSGASGYGQHGIRSIGLLSLHRDPAVYRHGRVRRQFGHDQTTICNLRQVVQASARRSGHRHHRGLRGVRRGIRVFGGHRSNHGDSRPARDESLQLRPPAVHGKASRPEGPWDS